MLAAPSSLPAVELADEMAPVEWHGIPGVFISTRGFNAMLVGFELEKGDIRTELARERTQGAMTREENKILRKDHDAMAWRATWGLPLGIGIGIVSSAIIGGVIAAFFAVVPR